MKTFNNTGHISSYDIVHLKGNKDDYTLGGTSNNLTMVSQNLDETYNVDNVESVIFKRLDTQSKKVFKPIDLIPSGPTPIHHFKFNGNGNDEMSSMVLNPTSYSYIDGFEGQALRAAPFASNIPLNSNSGTFSVRLKTSLNANVNGGYITKVAPAKYLGFYSSGRVWIGGSEIQAPQVHAAVDPNEWTLLTMVFDNGFCTIYINDTALFTGASSSFSAITNFNSGDSLQPLVTDDLKIFDIPLSASEVASLV